MYLYPEMHERIMRSLPLLAILTPRISGRRQKEISFSALQRAVAPSQPCGSCRVPAATLSISSIVSMIGCRACVLLWDANTIAGVIVPLLANSTSEVECLSNK